jgi:hypothetical protein
VRFTRRRLPLWLRGYLIGHYSVSDVIVQLSNLSVSHMLLAGLHRHRAHDEAENVADEAVWEEAADCYSAGLAKRLAKRQSAPRTTNLIVIRAFGM